MIHVARLAAVLAAVFLSTLAFSDNLTGHDRFLCSAGTVTACTEDGVCLEMATFDLNVPHFVEVDLAKKRLATTQASGQNRVTEIIGLHRKDGVVLVQGMDRGRAFSWLIDESTGLMTVAVATDGFTISVFGACTPMTESK